MNMDWLCPRHPWPCGSVLLSVFLVFISMAPLRFSSLNINGCRDAVKRARLFDYITIKSSGVVFLQETHTDMTNQTQWLSEWMGQAILSHGSSVSAGVAILLAPDFKEQPVSVFELVSGRLLRVDITICGIQFSFVNVYAPNIGAERVTFFKKLEVALSVVPQDRIIVVAGDFNCTLDHTLDRNHEEPHSHSADKLQSLITYHNLIDVWRESFSQVRQYTWLKLNSNMISGARLDRIYVRKNQRDKFYNSCIFPTSLSDHHFLSIDVTTSMNTLKLSYWKFNNKLLLDRNFVHSFTAFWEIWRERKVQFKSLSQWWDIGKVQIKLFCQSYSAYNKSFLHNKMAQLEQEILRLNTDGDIETTTEVFEHSKLLLHNLLEERAQEMLIRARFQTFNSMDAPTAFFSTWRRRLWIEVS